MSELYLILNTFIDTLFAYFSGLPVFNCNQFEPHVYIPEVTKLYRYLSSEEDLSWRTLSMVLMTLIYFTVYAYCFLLSGFKYSLYSEPTKDQNIIVWSYSKVQEYMLKLLKRQTNDEYFPILFFVLSYFCFFNSIRLKVLGVGGHIMISVLISIFFFIFVNGKLIRAGRKSVLSAIFFLPYDAVKFTFKETKKFVLCIFSMEFFDLYMNVMVTYTFRAIIGPNLIRIVNIPLASGEHITKWFPHEIYREGIHILHAAHIPPFIPWFLFSCEGVICLFQAYAYACLISYYLQELKVASTWEKKALVFSPAGLKLGVWVSLW